MRVEWTSQVPDGRVPEFQHYSKACTFPISPFFVSQQRFPKKITNRVETLISMNQNTSTFETFVLHELANKIIRQFQQ